MDVVHSSSSSHPLCNGNSKYNIMDLYIWPTSSLALFSEITTAGKWNYRAAHATHSHNLRALFSYTCQRCPINIAFHQINFLEMDTQIFYLTKLSRLLACFVHATHIHYRYVYFFRHHEFNGKMEIISMFWRQFNAILYNLINEKFSACKTF